MGLFLNSPCRLLRPPRLLNFEKISDPPAPRLLKPPSISYLRVYVKGLISVILTFTYRIQIALDSTFSYLCKKIATNPIYILLNTLGLFFAI